MVDGFFCFPQSNNFSFWKGQKIDSAAVGEAIRGGGDLTKFDFYGTAFCSKSELHFLLAEMGNRLMGHVAAMPDGEGKWNLVLSLADWFAFDPRLSRKIGHLQLSANSIFIDI